MRSKFEEARRQESTVGGRAERAVQRGASKVGAWAANKLHSAAETRIGREIGVSVKALVLGTKMLYDLQDPQKDLMTWAMSYEGDVNKLLRETDEVSQMKGPSLTGKNSIIEGMVNSAHRKLFR